MGQVNATYVAPSPLATLDDWTDMEARLILSRTDELLDEAATELAALPEAVASVWVEDAHDAIATAREAIGDLRESL